MDRPESGRAPGNGRFAGRVVLVTGGTSGIGKATALQFAADGATVALTGRRRDRGETTVEEIATAGGRARFFEADHTRLDDCSRVVQAVVDDPGRIDVLFNNAGIVTRGTAEETSAADWQRTFEINVTALWWMSRLVLPHFRRQGGGTIVNNASHWGLVASERAAAYCASKGAVIQLTRAMALDHAREGVRINAICPGDVMTEWRRDSDLAWVKTDGDLEKAGDYLPIGRIASPREIARAVLFLASEDAAYVTGTTLVVDGGHTAR